MKLATGLWVWVSLLLAAGTVQPSASQSGGSRFFLALQLLNLLAACLAVSCDVAPSFSLPIPIPPRSLALEGPLDQGRAWAFGRSSLHSKLTLYLCVCILFIVKNYSVPLLLSPLSS